MAVEPSKSGPAKAGVARLLIVALTFVAGTAAGGAGAVMAFTWLDQLPGTRSAHAAPTPPSKLEYVELDNSFTSNLTDTGRYLQLRIAVSTTGGPPVVGALVQHKLAVVSAVLGVLGDLAEADVAGRPAKARLKDRLRASIDAVLLQKAGIRGIDEVFLTSLVVQ